MASNGNNTQWDTLGIIIRTPNTDSLLRELQARADVYIVFSKKSRLKIKLVEESYK